jgi:hypothetical protein
MKRVPGKVARRQQKPRIVSIGITMYMAVTFRKKKNNKRKTSRLSVRLIKDSFSACIKQEKLLSQVK